MTTTEESSFVFADVSLARRLERAEGQSNAEFVEARARLFPESGAKWMEMAGVYAMYDGAKSPVTQTFGLGLFQTVTHSEMESIEAFYRERESPIFHEVSPLADSTLLTLLNERGYRPIELTSVLYRSLRGDIHLAARCDEKIKVRLAEGEEKEVWAQTSTKGWSEEVEFADIMHGLAQVNAAKSHALLFMAELQGQAIATGLMSIHKGIALLAGASTIPEARHQGAQLALLVSRLRYAADHGCDIAMMGALPGSSSQRNAERRGFRIAYTRIKWHLA